MRKIFLVICLFLLLCFVGTIVKAEISSDYFENAAVSETKKNEMVQAFKQAVKTNNPEIIAEYVEYPYFRPSPIPNINNKEEFIKQYNMLLDDQLRQTIIRSAMKDWEIVGQRGIMLDNGILWLDTEGKLIAINQSTKAENEYIANWYEQDRNSLYPPLRDYNTNIYIFETQQWKGRIDRLTEDGNDYRLVLWRKTDDMENKPEIVINHGTMNISETSDNSDYRFTKGDYIYSFAETNLDESADASPYQFIVYRGDKELLSLKATLVK